MNVNFKPSIAQGKSLRFGKSNDGKKTLLRPINLPQVPQVPQIPISETDNIALLMHLNGADGSTIFNDFSFNEIPLTGFRNTVISTGEYKFGGASAKFENTLGTTRDYIGSDNSSAFNFVSGMPWTLECWVNSTSLPSDNRSVLFSNCRMDSAGVNYEFYLKPTGSLQAHKLYLNDTLFETGEVHLNTWNHIAFSYDGNLTRGFINGVKAGEKDIHINVTNTNHNRIMFGALKYVGLYERSHFVGYMDEIRITTGVARYINNFIPSTGEFLNPLTEASIYINNIENIDGQSLEGNVKQSIYNFVNGCKQDNIWDSIKSCCILAGARTLSGALVPLKGSAPTNFNFVSSDYSRISGLKGNASSKYLDSNRSNLIDPLDSHHISIYIVETGSNSNNQCFIGSSFDSVTSIVTNFDNGAKFFSNRSTASFTTYQGANSGFRGVSRNNSSNYIYYISPNISGITNSNSSTPNNLNYSIFSLSYNDMSLDPRQFQYTDARISFYSIGEFIDLNLLQARVNTLMNDFQQIS
jgi:hypothetical protein